jgi:signal transduction histidine kinase
MTTPNVPTERPSRPSDAIRLTPQVLEAIAPLDEAHRQIVVAAEEARRRAESANLAKLEWLRAMSHELRTPLNAIGGFVQLLKSGARGEVPERMRDDLDRIERNQQHMASLINEVLQFARLDAGHVHFEIGRVPVGRLLLDLHDYIPLDEKARGRSLTVRRCSDDVVVIADEDKTRQILLNLITNALKHTPAASSITVSVARGTSDRVHLDVADNGPGIAPERLDRVFEPFVQAGGALNRPVDGLGLGLTIARELARGMGGDLTVASKLGKGTTFRLSLRRFRHASSTGGV